MRQTLVDPETRHVDLVVALHLLVKRVGLLVPAEDVEEVVLEDHRALLEEVVRRLGHVRYYAAEVGVVNIEGDDALVLKLVHCLDEIRMRFERVKVYICILDFSKVQALVTEVAAHDFDR